MDILTVSAISTAGVEEMVNVIIVGTPGGVEILNGSGFKYVN